MDNPFKQEMVRLQMPEGVGSTISVRGFMLEADADGCVEVPRDLVADLKSHGLSDPGVKKAPKK